MYSRYSNHITLVFKNKDFLRIWCLVDRVYSESSYCSDPVFDTRSGSRVVYSNRNCRKNVRLCNSAGQDIWLKDPATAM